MLDLFLIMLKYNCRLLQLYGHIFNLTLPSSVIQNETACFCIFKKKMFKNVWVTKVIWNYRLDLSVFVSVVWFEGKSCCHNETYTRKWKIGQRQEGRLTWTIEKFINFIYFDINAAIRVPLYYWILQVVVQAKIDIADTEIVWRPQQM